MYVRINKQQPKSLCRIPLIYHQTFFQNLLVLKNPFLYFLYSIEYVGIKIVNSKIKIKATIKAAYGNMKLKAAMFVTLPVSAAKRTRKPQK